VPDFSADIEAVLLAARDALLGHDETSRYEALRYFTGADSRDDLSTGTWVENPYPGPAKLTAALADRDPRVFAFTPKMLATLDATTGVGFADALVSVPKDRRTGRFDADAASSAQWLVDGHPQHQPGSRSTRSPCPGWRDRRKDCS
jgi:hypothetical protein